MIAEPDSSTNAQTAAAAVVVETSPLTPNELYQLTLYKWRYSLEAYGFEPTEVRALMFMKWLYASHRVQG